jgi:hypothetical protein
MKHIITYESYHDKHLNNILDKINQSGISSLSDTEKEFLNAYSIDDVEKMTHIEYEVESKEFDDKYFHFKLSDIKYMGDKTLYFGKLTVPDLEWPNGKRIKGELEGHIIFYSNHMTSPVFEKDGYDVFEFCNGLEYELDSFIDYVISTLEDEKTVE